MVLIAFLYVVHGFAHLVGFIVSWRLAKMEEMPYRTTLLNGTVDVGHAGIRIVGILWLLTALAFLGIATGMLTHWDGWLNASIIIAGFSTLLCILGWPDARIGLFLNLVILAFTLLAKYFSWF